MGIKSVTSLIAVGFQMSMSNERHRENKRDRQTEHVNYNCG